jgi:hypothetical protein
MLLICQAETKCQAEYGMSLKHARPLTQRANGAQRASKRQSEQRPAAKQQSMQLVKGAKQQSSQALCRQARLVDPRDGYGMLNACRYDNRSAGC